MENSYINLNPDNIANEHLCCIIRTKKPHPGVEAKREWLDGRLKEGHVFRKLDKKATVFIEYAPLEKAWVPIEGESYYYIYCLWVLGEEKGNGYGKELMEYCISDAKLKGKSGICMLGSKKQKAWLSDAAFAKKFGFKPVDSTENGYELLALSFDGSVPHFAPKAKTMKIESKDLTIYYDFQCPYILQTVQSIEKYCAENEIRANFIKIESCEAAKQLPCVFNNFAVFFNGEFATVNLTDTSAIKRIIKKAK